MVRDGGSRFHEGIDVKSVKKMGNGTPMDLIYAVYPGIVAHLSPENNGSYGRYVVLLHRKDGFEFYTLYGHLLSVSPALKEGDTIRAGTILHRCVAGREYSFDYFIKFLPEDAKFSEFLLSDFSLLSNNTNVLQVVDNGTTPTNWTELYNSKKVISIASGRARLHCIWKGATAFGGYTDLLVSVTSS